MGIFEKKSAGLKESADGAINSIIGQDMVLSGDVSFQGKLRLDGRVEGDVKGEHLVLGETGHIAGDVEASVFVCHGTVSGDISAEKLFAVDGCRINGKIQATDLSVESGASVVGEVRASAKDLRLVSGSEEEVVEPKARESA